MIIHLGRKVLKPSLKVSQGKYNAKQAHVLFAKYIVPRLASAYVLSNGGSGIPWSKARGEAMSKPTAWQELFEKADILALAQEYVERFEDGYAVGDYDHYIPKKYPKGDDRAPLPN